MNLLFNTELINKNDRIVIGVSGGPDSICLLNMLNELKEKFNLYLVIAHINHDKRGVESDLEEQFVIQFGNKLNIPVYSTRLVYENKNGNFQEIARNMRYDYFLDVAKQNKCNKLALAHHADDQVETILMRILRGSDLEGLSGIKKKRRFQDLEVIRPLLGVNKEQIVSYCDENKIEYKIDSSNKSNKYTRNRIRRNVLNILQSESADYYLKFKNFAETIEDTSNYIEKVVKKKYNALIKKNSIDLLALKNEDKFIQSRIVYKYLKDNLNNKDLTKEHVSNVMKLINNNKPNSYINFSDEIIVKKEYNKLYFTQKEQQEDFRVIINQFGEHKLPNGDIIVIEENTKDIKTYGNYSVNLCYNNKVWPIIIRTRKEGDAIKLKYGTKKINRLFIDKKIPIDKRNIWPIIENNSGEIILIPGIAKKEDKNMCEKDIILKYFTGGFIDA